MPKTDQSEVVASGEAAAFAAGRTVLDIASGQAIALEQASLEYPDTSFWGIDMYYLQARPINPDLPGVQLTRSDWDTLEGVPGASVDTIITNAGPFLWAEGYAYLDAVTRVAAKDAILRFLAPEIVDSTEDPDEKVYKILQGLTDRGWDITVSDHHNTVVGIKRS